MHEAASIPLAPGMVPYARQLTATVRRQRKLARDTYAITIDCPEIAERIVPGQFFMVRSIDGDDPLLGRPFALYDVFESDHHRAGVEFAYIVVGKLTSLMTNWQPGKPVSIWGPLGNGFPKPSGGHVMFAAGGIGHTPFLAVAREALGLQSYGSPRRAVSQRPQRVSMLYGVRSAEYLAGLDDFETPGLKLNIATDDGSRGHHGLVTDLLRDKLDSPDRPDRVFCCGPEPMMQLVSEMCEQLDVECWLSLESPMACGFGACFSCVTRVRLDDGSWDYRRTCVEGPVFPANRLVFHGE